MKYFQLAFLLPLLVFTACKKGDSGLSPEEQLQVDLEIIQQYLTDNSLAAQSTASGLHYVIEEEGTGEFPTSDGLVEMKYTGYLIDNTVWGTSYYGPDALSIPNLGLPGLREGIPLFRTGSKGKILLPSALAFGQNGATEVVIFDIELTELCLSDSTLADKVSCLDLAKIGQYLAENSLTADVTASGLHYIIEDEGVGNAHPALSDFVEVFYKGYLLDGRVFDETTISPATFQLSGVIDGWKEGMRLFKKGGKGKLFIPSSLAYEAAPPNGSGIPFNAVLVFDIELVDF